MSVYDNDLAYFEIFFGDFVRILQYLILKICPDLATTFRRNVGGSLLVHTGTGMKIPDIPPRLKDIWFL